MKLIAWHLPQFHEIEANNTWWGRGFTEWVNVKKAKPRFSNHNQPRVPLEGYYYNLLDKHTLEWQAQLAKKYGVYGFCFYQYWFNGKKLLEKPIENLLKWQDIELRFCLSWANEPWTRAWDGGDKEILMPQDYGTEEEWKKHFEYLKDFFADERYIKVNNKPIYLIYRSNNIPGFAKMIALWNEMAVELGYGGIHIVETLNSFQNKKQSKLSAAAVYMEPMYTITWDKPFVDRIKNALRRRLSLSPLRVFDYKSVWRRIVKRTLNPLVYPGAFVDWDNSARKRKATIFLGADPEIFNAFLHELIQKHKDSDFLFINAWNEWAEGTYLEPDEKNGHGYLESVLKAQESLANNIVNTDRLNNHDR